MIFKPTDTEYRRLCKWNDDRLHAIEGDLFALLKFAEERRQELEDQGLPSMDLWDNVAKCLDTARVEVGSALQWIRYIRG